MDLFQLLLFRFVHRAGCSFHFFHGPAIYAFLLDRLGNPPRFPVGCGFLPVESGRVHYAPGEAYHVGLILEPRAELDAADWMRVLAQPPRTRFGKTAGAPFGGGTSLHSVVDVVSDRRLAYGQRGRFIGTDDMRGVAGRLCGATTIEIGFQSQLQILRTPVARKNTVFDDRSFDPVVFLGRVGESIGRAFPNLFPASPVPEVRLLANRMARTDASYPGKTIPGARGSIVMEIPCGLPHEWALALVVAGVIGVGKATNMGQGRFGVVGAAPVEGWPPRAARSIASRAGDPSNLALAREAVSRSGRTPGVDGIDHATFLDSLTYRMDILRERLETGEASAKPLRGIALRKADGRLRGLAVPTFEDRFLQRACFQELDPAVEQLLEDSNFAYRRGLSRRNAELSVRKAHDEGFKHVLDADIRSFFDFVDWQLLEVRLRALFGDDPIAGLLMAWVKAPVEFGGRLIHRTTGLPQGAVISPLLANVYLDVFDEAMAEQGFRLVRYADDFLVLCRSAEDVERARRTVDHELARLRLQLADEKTTITSFERGFRFLGFLFCRSLVFESPSGAARLLRADEWGEWPDAAEVDASQTTGWLETAIAGSPSGEGDVPAPEERWRRPIVGAGGGRRPMYVIDPGVRLTGSHRGVRAYDGSVLRAEVAWQRISEIAILGGRQMSASLFQQALRHRVPVSLYSRSGEPVGLVLPDRVRTPGPLTRAHWHWHEAGETRMAVARSLVEAKIHNLRLLARRQRGDNADLLQYLERRSEDALRCESLERLRGIEGQAAHAWFARWPGWLEGAFPFPGRSGRGARDPINAVLNLLYSQLFRLCWMAAIAEGLDPYLGCLHEGRGRYAALAADLQEPFRFLCDRLGLRLAHTRQLSTDDFASHEKTRPVVRIRESGLRTILSAWEASLNVTVRAGEETLTFRDHICAQARRFAQVVQLERAELKPFRLRW